MTGEYELDHQRDVWDAEAAAFDEAPDHGLRDPAVRRVWRDLLLSHLPGTPGRAADLGCGTGTLSLLLADAGWRVDGLDLSPEMVRLAREKAGGRTDVSYVEGDASAPPFEAGAYDAVLCRHVLWALPEPVDALRRWEALLAPGGRMLMVEGRWFNGAGLAAPDTVELLAAAGRTGVVTPMPEPAYWGREISDERYLVVS